MKRDALVVGINQYPFLKDNPKNPALHLQTPAADADAIAHLLESYGDFAVHRLPAKEGVKEVDPKKLLKTAELQAAIRQLFCPQGNSIPDTALLFFAGHGLRKNQDGETEGFLATSEASLRKNLWGISLKWLRQVLQESRVRQQIIWLDCCHSGELLNFTEAELGEYEKGRVDAQRLLVRDRSLIVASRDFQVAYGDGEHGMLTNALLQSLDPANRPDGWVTNFTLVDRVRELLKAAPQHPVCTNTGGQIILTGKNGVLANICPYKGLAYFDWNEEDPKYFYGRTRLTNLLLEKVQSGNFLAVLGASGSGKSSVVRAGLLYQLQLGEAIPGSERWKIYPPFTPGDRPLQRLKEVVGVEAEQLEPLIKAAAAERVVLVVDQFEEVFTQCRDDRERQQFFKCLLETLERTENKLCLILVMRSDFQGQCDEYPELATKIDSKPIRVMKMSQDELKEAITKPAEKVGLEIERELVTQMIADVEGSPGDLPLLQYALTELWQQKRTNRLTVSEYTQIGGVKQALEKQANKVYQLFSPQEQQVAKRIFLALTQMNEGIQDTRRRVRKQDLITHQQSETIVERVLARLTEAKLLIADKLENENERVPVIDIAHEALIRRWQLLRDWLKENREAVIRKQDIEDAAQVWRDNQKPKDPAYLLQGTRLAVAEDYLQRYGESVPLSSVAQEYVQLSQAERDRLEAESLSNLALRQFQSGEGQIDALMIAMQAGLKLKQLVKHGESLANYPTTSPLLALQIILSNIREKNDIKSNTEGINKVIVTPDGKQIVSFSGKDCKVIIWNILGQKIAEWDEPENKTIQDLAISPNSKYVVTVNAKDNLYIFDFCGKQIANIRSTTPPLISIPGNNIVKFSPDSQYIVRAIRSDSRVDFFNLSGQKIRELVTYSPNTIHSLEFTSNGEELLTGNNVGMVQFWDLKSLQKIREFKANTNQVVRIVISPDEKHLLTLGVDINSLQADVLISRLWDLSGKKIADLSFVSILNDNLMGDVTFSFDGKQIATVFTPFGTVSLYNTISREFIEQLTINSYFGASLTYSRDDNYILVSGLDGIKIFSKAKNNDIELPIINSEIETNSLTLPIIKSLHYSADGERILIILDNQVLDIWDWKQKKVEKKFSLDDSFANISPDGNYIITVTKEAVQKFDLEGNLISEVKANISKSEAVLLLRTFREDYLGDRTYSSSFDGSKIVTLGLGTAQTPSPVRLWDLSTHQVNKLENDYISKTCNGVAISPNGKYIFTLASGIVKIWDACGNLLTQLDVKNKTSVNGKEISSIALFLDNSKKEVTIFDQHEKKWVNFVGIEILEIWQNSTAMKAGLKSGDIILEIDSHKVSEIKDTELLEVLYSLLRGKPGTNVKIKLKPINSNIEEKTIIREIFVYDKSQVVFGDRGKFSPDSQYLAIFYMIGEELQLININGDEVINLDNQVKIENIYFSPNSKLIATTGADYSIKIWDMYGKLVTQIKLQQPSTNLAFSPDSQQIGILGYPNELSVWNIAGKQIAKYIVPEQGQGHIQFSPDGKYIATAGRKVFIWQNQNLNELLATGYEWLEEYLATRPQEKEKLKGYKYKQNCN